MRKGLFFSKYPFYLASASPRRQTLLASLGIDFAILPSGAEPGHMEQETPERYAARSALAKAEDCRNTHPQTHVGIVLAADTVISHMGKAIGKPRDHEDAFRILTLLNNGVHQVVTAIALLLPRQLEMEKITKSVSTEVTFGNWSPRVLKNYAYNEEPMDKAGAYAIQGDGGFLISGIKGSWSNVVGLPLETLTRILLELDLLEIS